MTIYQKILQLFENQEDLTTMNEIAKKLKDKKLADKIIGIAVTGSF